MTVVRRYAVLAAGFVVMVAGAILVTVTDALNQPAHGFAAYVPLSSTYFFPPPPALLVGGYVLIGLGLCAITGWVGFQAGRQRR